MEKIKICAGVCQKVKKIWFARKVVATILFHSTPLRISNGIALRCNFHQ